MNLNNFTIKAQEAVQKAQELASAFQNQSVENIHILKGILTIDENVIPYLLKKLNVNTEVFSKALDKQVESLPKVSGGEQFLSADATKSLQKAISISKSMKDDFVSIEHIVLGIISVNDTAARLLKDNGVTEHDLMTAIRQLRQGSSVKSQSAERDLSCP
jgi:ATP-dependent Clp protease ATP-binding subunit ClpB